MVLNKCPYCGSDGTSIYCDYCNDKFRDKMLKENAVLKKEIRALKIENKDLNEEFGAPIKLRVGHWYKINPVINEIMIVDESNPFQLMIIEEESIVEDDRRDGWIKKQMRFENEKGLTADLVIDINSRVFDYLEYLGKDKP